MPNTAEEIEAAIAERKRQQWNAYQRDYRARNRDACNAKQRAYRARKKAEKKPPGSGNSVGGKRKINK